MEKASEIKMEKENFSLESFKNIQQLIVFLHNKANAILVIDGLLITLIVNFAKDLRFIDPFHISLSWYFGISLLAFLFGFSLFIFLIYQIYYIIYEILKPNLAENYSENERSLFYFEHISVMGRSKYLEEIKKLKASEINLEIDKQVFEVATILTKKTKKLSIALKQLFISFCLSLCFILCIKLLQSFGD